MMLSTLIYICISKFSVQYHLDFTVCTYNMDAADYWPMVREYLIWNATIASLQFWTADLNMLTLGSAIEEVYSTFFYTASTHTLHQQSDEILFGCFVTTLNAAFELKLALEDEGYESSSENFNMPTPLRKTQRIHHMSSIKNVPFNPDLVTPCNTDQSNLRAVHRWLTYSSSDDIDTSEDEAPTASRATPDAQVHLEEDEEEDFQMVPLDDEHWTTEEVPDRTLCMHEHALPHGLCLYLSPYENYLLPSYANTMDLSDISNFEDIMIMSSDKDIPALEDAPY